jgi:hydroxymethylbilane synthase
VTEAIRLGTRASLLARTQSAAIGAAIADLSGRPWVEVPVRTLGDDTTKPLDQPGTPGLFVSTLREALLSGEVDVIVHSYKDLPSAAEPGIVLASVPERVDPADALVSTGGLLLSEIAPGSLIGTSSPRRAAAIKRTRPDLEVVPVRGNVDTRIRHVREGRVAATVMAVAGLTRIGRESEITEILGNFLPAPAQGALAVECREGDKELLALLTQLDDPWARLVTTAERQVLVAINAACTTPIGALAHYESGELRLQAELTRNGQYTSADVAVSCGINDLSAARTLGFRAAAELSGSTRPVLLIRSEGNETDAESLDELGIPSISEPYVRIVPEVKSDDAERLIAFLRDLSTQTGTAQRAWLIATSPMTVPSWLAAVDGDVLADAIASAQRAGIRAAATGERTAMTLRDLGFTDVLIPEEASARGLLRSLQGETPGPAIFPHGNLALRTLPEGLTQLGWDVREGIVYRTDTVAERPASADLVEGGEVSAIILRSPSAVRALINHVRVPDSVAIVCAGATTEEAARAAGLRISDVASSPRSVDVARSVRQFLGDDTTPIGE